MSQHPFGHLPVLQVPFAQQVGHSGQQAAPVQQEADTAALRRIAAFALPALTAALLTAAFLAAACVWLLAVTAAWAGEARKPVSKKATGAKTVIMRFIVFL